MMLKFIDENDFLLVEQFKENFDGTVQWFYQNSNGCLKTGFTRTTQIQTGTTPVVIGQDENGDDISGTRLGQALFIRIELVGDTIFDIFARNLVAKSGLDEEEIVLLDDRGCPADLVFPGLEKDPDTGALLGKFEAFKFSDTTVVNFEVNVQFCQDRCNPVS